MSQQRSTRRILHIKRLVERGRRADLAEAAEQRSQAEARFDRATEAHARVLSELTSEREATAHELADLARHVGMAADVVRAERAKLVVEQQKESSCQERMHEATRDVKTFERLDARKLEERQTMLRRYEQTTLDELGSARRGRP